MKNPAFGSAMPLQMRNGNESHFMDAIADRVVTDFGHPETFTDDPSLLTVILDLNPLGWYNIRNRGNQVVDRIHECPFIVEQFQ